MSARAFDYDAYADLRETKGRYPVRFSYNHPLADPDRPLYASGRYAAASLHSKFFDHLTSTDEELRGTEWAALTDVVANGAASNAVASEARDRRRLDASSRIATGDFAYSGEQTDAIVAWLTARTEATSAAVEQRFLEISVSDALTRIERDEIALLAGHEEHARDNINHALREFLEASPDVGRIKDQIAVLWASTENVTDLSYEGYLATEDVEDLRLSLIDEATRGIDREADPDAWDAALESIDLPESRPEVAGEADRLTADDRADIVRSMLGSEVAARGLDARRGVKTLDSDNPAIVNGFAVLLSERSALHSAIERSTNENDPSVRALLDSAAFGRSPALLDANPLAQSVLQSNSFASYRRAAHEFAATLSPSADPLAIMHTEVMAGRGDPLERVDFIAANREEAEIVKAWTEFAARHGARVPSRETVAAFAHDLEQKLSEPLIQREPTAELLAIPKFDATTTKEFWDGLSSGKTIADLEAEGVSRRNITTDPTWAAFYEGQDTARMRGENGFETLVIARSRTLRPATLGERATPLFVPVHAMDGSTFYKNNKAVEDVVARVASDNAQAAWHNRTAIAIPVDTTAEANGKGSSAIKLIREAAEKAGFETVAVTVDSSARSIRSLDQNGLIHTKKDRSMILTVADPNSPEAAQVPLFSREGQRAIRPSKLVSAEPGTRSTASIGKLLILTPSDDMRDHDDPSRISSQGRALLRQAAATIATQATIFGPTRSDAHAGHAIRNFDDLRKPFAVIDAKGAETPYSEALKLAKMAAPKRRDAARVTFTLDTAFRSLASVRVTSDLGRFFIAEASDFRQSQRLAANPAIRNTTIEDLVNAASRPTSALRNPQTTEDNRHAAVAKAMGGALRATFSDIRTLSHAIRAASDMHHRTSEKIQTLFEDRKNDAYRGKAYRLDASSRFAEAAGQPVILRAIPGVDPADSFKGIAIIGDGTAPSAHTAEKIAAIAKTAAANHQPLITTADPLGAAVVDAAVLAQANVIVVSSTSSYDRLGDASARRFANLGLNGHSIFVTTDLEPETPTKRTPVMARLSELEIATSLANGVVLAAAKSNDPSVYVAANAGASQLLIADAGKPVLTIPGTSGADDLMHAGSASFRTGRGGSGDAKAAILFLDADGKPDTSRREFEDAVVTHHTWRSASWTRPIAASSNDDTSLALFMTRSDTDRRSSSIRNASEHQALTAADMRLLTGAVRYASPSEIYETGGTEFREEVSRDYTTAAMRELADAFNNKVNARSRVAAEMAESDGRSHGRSRGRGLSR